MLVYLENAEVFGREYFLQLVFKFFQTRFTKNHKKVFRALSVAEGYTFTKTVRILEEELKLSRSTVKRALALFRELDLIDVGDRHNQGKELKLTSLGKYLLEKQEG